MTSNRPQNLTHGRSRHAEAESEVKSWRFLHPEAKIKENRPRTNSKKSLNISQFCYSIFWGPGWLSSGRFLLFQDFPRHFPRNRHTDILSGHWIYFLFFFGISWIFEEISWKPFPVSQLLIEVPEGIDVVYH